MPTYSYAYLICSLFWLGVWGVLFILLKNQRREMGWTSLWLAPSAPIGEFWSLQDYWNPAYVFEFRWGEWRFGGVEDYILGFALAGICAGLFEFFLARRGAVRVPPMRWRSFWRLARWLVLGLLLFIAGAAMGLRSIHTLFLAVLLTSVIMLWRRPALWGPIVLLSLAFAFVYWLFYVLFLIPRFPGSIEAVWKLENTWGIRWGGVPIEELVWAGLTMLFAGPYLWASLAPPEIRHNNQAEGIRNCKAAGLLGK